MVLRGGLYYMDDFSEGKAHQVKSVSDVTHQRIWHWHCRLGHPSFSYMKHLLPDLFSNVNESNFKCETCILAKSHRVPFPLRLTTYYVPFSLVHSYVWGPSPVPTFSGVRWFVTFVDDCTRMTWVYLLKHKSDVPKLFQYFHAMIQTQFSFKLQILRSDNGGEYVNSTLKSYFSTHGLLHETSCPDTPQQNGVAERKNRHILETARAFLIGAHAPRRFWADAIVTAVYLLNRMPSKVLDFQTPLQTLSTQSLLPSVLMLPPRTFGCVAFVHLLKTQRIKLDPCALRCVFLGYATHQKGYRCYYPPTQRTYVIMDVTFLESEMYFTPSSNPSLQGEIRYEEHNWTNFDFLTKEPETMVTEIRTSINTSLSNGIRSREHKSYNLV